MTDRQPLTLGLAHSLHRASQYVDDLFADAAARYGITARQLTVLEIIAQLDKPSQNDLCVRSGIDRSTIADMVLRLVTKGYVARRRSRTDARRYVLQLTEAGREVLDGALPIAREVEARVAAALPGEQRTQLTEGLHCIVRSLQTRDASSP